MTLAAVYGSSPTKRDRRTKADIERICDELIEVVADEQPMTVRQVFYQMVSRGAIDKTEQEYKGTVGRLLLQLRREGRIPYGWIADNTRWMRKPTTHTGLRDMLVQSARLYRRALWQDQAAYVEIWLEKDALAGVLSEVTYEWDVPLMVTRGYASESYLYSAADAISDSITADKEVFVYYFGDHDPSGVNITEVVERRLREMVLGICTEGLEDADPGWLDDWFHFERVAVTREQISRWSLPTRPTKKTDVRSHNFEGESVEVDAIPPDQLRDLVRECIEQHIDERALARTIAVEEAERKSLAAIVEALPGAGS